ASSHPFLLTSLILRCSTLIPYTTLFRSVQPRTTHGDWRIENVGFWGQVVRAPDRQTRRSLRGRPEPGSAFRSALHPLGCRLGIRSEEHTLNSSHLGISYAVFCLKKKKTK